MVVVGVTDKLAPLAVEAIKVPPVGESHHLITPIELALIFKLELQPIEDGFAKTFVGFAIGVTVIEVLTLFALLHIIVFHDKVKLPFPYLYP